MRVKWLLRGAHGIGQKKICPATLSFGIHSLPQTRHRRRSCSVYKRHLGGGHWHQTHPAKYSLTMSICCPLPTRLCFMQTRTSPEVAIGTEQARPSLWPSCFTRFGIPAPSATSCFGIAMPKSWSRNADILGLVQNAERRHKCEWRLMGVMGTGGKGE